MIPKKDMEGEKFTLIFTYLVSIHTARIEMHSFKS